MRGRHAGMIICFCGCAARLFPGFLRGRDRGRSTATAWRASPPRCRWRGPGAAGQPTCSLPASRQECRPHMAAFASLGLVTASGRVCPCHYALHPGGGKTLLHVKQSFASRNSTAGIRLWTFRSSQARGLCGAGHRCAGSEADALGGPRPGDRPRLAHPVPATGGGACRARTPPLPPPRPQRPAASPTRRQTPAMACHSQLRAPALSPAGDESAGGGSWADCARAL